MPLEDCLEIAISKLENGQANEKEKILVLANESIGTLKNGGFLYFYNYDFSNDITHAEVIDAHSAINPEIKILHQGFQNYLSSNFYDKTPDERYEELRDILDEDGEHPAHAWLRRLFKSIKGDFKKLEDWVRENRSAFNGCPDF